MTKAVVTNCHELSVRRDIFLPENADQIAKVLKRGETLFVDTSHTYWDSWDNQYYKADVGIEGDCYVITGGVSVV